MLYRVLSKLDPADYCLISKENYERGREPGESANRLKGRYLQLPYESHWWRLRRHRLGEPVRRLNILWRVWRRAWNIRTLLRQERCEAVVACTGDLIDMPAGYLASRLVGIPFFAYLFDDYVFQWRDPWDRRLAGWFGSLIFKRAANVISPNEYLRDDYQTRYGITPVIIRNPCSRLEWVSERAPGAQADANGNEAGIVYTGYIYCAHYDAFRNLVGAIDKLGRTDFKLHLYTATPEHELAREGILTKSVVYHGYKSYDEAQSAQQRATVLFLPLAFNSPYPDVIRTSAPGKMGEYLANGRPVLVHAPRDSFVSWYFRQHRCGVVADENNPGAVLRALEEIIENKELRRLISRNGIERARSDFCLETAQNAFHQLFATRKEHRPGAGSERT